ncbi:MAG TPA: VWA domain-containing protein [Acidobacteriaceae bacterium]|nr:VWA domain-containing protein [Acidobacteriaceae bacterium]
MRGRIALPLTLLALCVAAPPLRAKRKPPAQPQSGAAPAFSVTSRIVLLDVVVLNHNQPVCGLKTRDFQVLEDRQDQRIEYFQSHCGKDAKPEQALPKPPSPPPHTYDNLPVTPVTDSVTVLLLDGLNTQVADNQYLRLQMIQYLRNLPPGQRIAIFALGSHLRMLQGFTTNSEQLLAAISSRKATPAASLLPSASHTFAQRQELDTLREAGISPQTIMNMKNFMSESDTQETGMRVSMTLEAMQEMARYLSGIPGRKNLIWFSGSFPVEFYSDVETPTGNTYTVITGSFQDQLKATAAMLAAARVAVYPVDVRGVLVEPMFDASQQTDYGEVINSVPVGQLRFAHDGMLADLERIEEHGTMIMLAKETGGRAVYDSNALKEAVADALSDGEHFYTIAYTPRNADFKGKWRKIDVSLDVEPAKGKYKLLFRHGYFATSGTPEQDTGEQGERQVFAAAMQDGVPPSSQILFKARVVAPDKHPPTGPILGQNQKMKDRGARYVIDYAISLRHVDLALAPHGVHAGRVIVEAVAFNDEGNPVNWISNVAPIALTPAVWNMYAEDGLQVHQVLDVPKEEIRLHLGVYDPASGNVGTMEIPIQAGPKKPALKTEARR